MSSLGDVQIHLVQSVDDAFELMRWLSTHSGSTARIGFDTENTGLSPEKDRVRLVQLGDAMHGWVIPFQRWGGVFEDVVKRYEGRYVAHNAPYDVAMARKEGITVPHHRVDDTRIRAHVLDSTGPLGLKQLAVRYVDPAAATGQELLDRALGGKGGWTWENIPIEYEPYWVYAGLDPVLTYRLDDVLAPMVATEAPLSYDLELAVAWICERMERRGVMIDRDYIQQFSGELSTYVREVEAWVKSNYGCTPGSSDAIINALRRDGVDLVKRTPSGARFSLDKEVLASINHPLAQVVLQHRQAQKLVSTYLRNYLEMAGSDDIIHPSINTIGGMNKNPFEPGGGSGVRTGRMSMSNPNLQNVPIRTELGRKIRRAFLAAIGYDWIKADADQIEMRILAHLSGDQAMRQAFLGEGDFFVNMARQLFSEPDFQKDDPRRSFVKNGGYAKIYGSGIDKFAATVGVDAQVAAAFMTQFDRTFSGVPVWIRSVEREAVRNRDTEGVSYIRSPMTNRRHVADPGKEWTLVNYEIQGMAGELLKLKIVEADAAGLGQYMRFPVHDELNLNVPKDEVSDVMATLTEVLNDDKILDVPLTWSAGVAQRWGDIK